MQPTGLSSSPFINQRTILITHLAALAIAIALVAIAATNVLDLPPQGATLFVVGSVLLMIGICLSGCYWRRIMANTTPPLSSLAKIETPAEKMFGELKEYINNNYISPQLDASKIAQTELIKWRVAVTFNNGPPTGGAQDFQPNPSTLKQDVFNFMDSVSNLSTGRADIKEIQCLCLTKGTNKKIRFQYFVATFTPDKQIVTYSNPRDIDEVTKNQVRGICQGINFSYDPTHDEFFS